MTRNKTFWLGIVATVALAAAGCSDDNNNAGTGGMGGDSMGGTGGTGGDSMGGTGGTGGDSMGGTGGMGGAPAEMAMVRVAHLGTDLPTADNTAVDVTVNGTVAIEDLTFAQSTGFIPLPAAEYTFGVNVADTDTEVFSITTTLAPGSISTVVAISSVNNDNDDQDVLNVLVFDGNLENLEGGNGRVLVGHGFDNPDFDTVDVILAGGGDCTLIEDLVFATVRDDIGDLPANTYPVGLAVPDSCDFAVGPLDGTILGDVATLLVAAADANGAVQVYAIIGEFSSGQDMTPIPTLEASAE